MLDATTKLEATKTREAIAKKTYELFGQVTTKELENIYEDVKETFCKFYRIFNSDDENSFTAELTPSKGSLVFDVDFYDRGFFPPGAYHSEGHQDSMGLCLYLALMQHLLSNKFSFSVLDDVLMSVDAGHRREVCALLKQEFPNTQFILTTHDDIWLRHMKSAGLIKRQRFVHFRKWSVDIGPTEWNDRDVWDEINNYLDQNDVRSSAALLRHYLEYFYKELCHRIRAQVVFRGDAQYTLGDLLPSAISRFKKLLKNGISCAESWGQTEKKEAIKTQLNQLESAVNISKDEQWQINTAVHYNEWDNLNKKDFKAVVNGFKNLSKSFECLECSELLFISPEKGEKQSLRCGCSEININLRSK